MAARLETLRRRLAALGFDEVRVARIEAVPAEPLRDWLAAGRHADMTWMERTAEKRLQPGLALPGARSVIMLGVNYWPGALRQEGPVWARYALHEDYHDTIQPALAAAGRVLEELYGVKSHDYRYYVDTGPVLERGWAAKAGLGFAGKNAMLISPRHGNWLFLAAILTRLELAPDAPLREQQSGFADTGLLCGKCTRCLDACPTRAFAAPGVVDSRRCISYQTIENKGTIPRELRAGIGRRIYGCDVCLEICPWNRFAREGRRLLLAARFELPQFTLAELLALTPERFAAVFRRTAIKQLKLTGLLRNACVVAGNAGDVQLLPSLARLAAHASPLVRAHAVWAVRRLAAPSSASALLLTARVVEADAIVLAEYEGEP
jgi:epoxyqueuosine reductase